MFGWITFVVIHERIRKHMLELGGDIHLGATERDTFPEDLIGESRAAMQGQGDIGQPGDSLQAVEVQFRLADCS